MTHPQTDTQPGQSHLGRALEHADRLAKPRPAGAALTADWFAQAHHVGDISVLALALRR